MGIIIRYYFSILDQYFFDFKFYLNSFLRFLRFIEFTGFIQHNLFDDLSFHCYIFCKDRIAYILLTSLIIMLIILQKIKYKIPANLHLSMTLKYI